jgi:hypothetical protein
MAEEEKKDHERDPQYEGRGGEHMSGLFIGTRSLWLLAGGALGALGALGIDRLTRKVRPAAVGLVKEGYAFKEWFTGKYEKVKEDFEDILAEAVYEYERDQERAADATQREKALLEKIEKIVEARLAQMEAEKKESPEEDQP